MESDQAVAAARGGRELDAAALGELMAVYGAGDVRELAELLIGDLNEGLATIRMAHSGDDLVKIAATAHTLKSATLYLGATSYSALCERIERLAGGGDADMLAAPLLELAARGAQVRGELDALVARLT